MEFIRQAGPWWESYPCSCCDTEIRATDPIWFDCDEDGVTVLHEWCHRFGEEERARGRAEAYREASLLLQHNSTADALTALQFRAAHRQVPPSGIDLFHVPLRES